MATEQQKEELMQTLKFTPRKYKVEIWGYGGEIYWGSVDRKIYEFFKDKAIDIEQYAGSWDDDMWADIPDDMRPFEPGSPYECDHGCHLSGATFDESSYVTVYDENGDQVWQSSLDSVALAEQGVGYDCIDEKYINEYDAGTVVFMGAQGEKGLFFSNEFELKSPFDPSKLQINYEDCDGWMLTSNVSYDGEDIDGNDYDTTGKWGENKWIIVGDEEVYDGVERDEESYEDTSDDDEEITLDEEWDPAAELDKICPPDAEWTDKEVTPEQPGSYEVVYDAEWPNSGIGLAEWDGSSWTQDGEALAIKQWREWSAEQGFDALKDMLGELGEQIGADEDELTDIEEAEWPFPPSVDEK